MKRLFSKCIPMLVWFLHGASSAGAAMVLDQPEERGLAFVEERWGDPKECRFPLFSFLKPLPIEGMYCVHLVMLLGKLRFERNAHRLDSLLLLQ
ncbi:hypothetical protein HPB48_019608 [Haemaphysalis longicornis]|uniref:HTTM domain-containing protein n=1 Tax=Haemaphysalis longicornis TaxID=44386 RepID=A0A9J6F733_HAELO|nr:hypothetical protein HPB48_019608 [Haemaphysalis longicornis]